MSIYRRKINSNAIELAPQYLESIYKGMKEELKQKQKRDIERKSKYISNIHTKIFNYRNQTYKISYNSNLNIPIMNLFSINYSGKDLKGRRINLVYIIGSNKDLKSFEFTSKITKGTQKKSTHTSIADKNYIAIGIFTGKLIEKYGEKSPTVIAERPYQLAADITGVGFRTADNIARDVGIDPDHPDRADAATIHLIREAEGQGHCFLPKRHLIERVLNLEVGHEHSANAISRLVLSLVPDVSPSRHSLRGATHIHCVIATHKTPHASKSFKLIENNTTRSLSELPNFFQKFIPTKVVFTLGIFLLELLLDFSLGGNSRMISTWLPKHSLTFKPCTTNKNIL